MFYQKASTHIIVPIHYQEMSTLKANNEQIDKTSVEKKSAVELKVLANSNRDEEDAMSAVNEQTNKTKNINFHVVIYTKYKFSFLF